MTRTEIRLSCPSVCDPTFLPIAGASGATADLDYEVMEIGYPRSSGARVTATLGVMLDDWLGDTLGLISYGAPLNPSSSGGPLFSMEGPVLGVNMGSSNFEEGVFCAVPYEVIEEDVLAWKARLVVLLNTCSASPGGSRCMGTT